MNLGLGDAQKFYLGNQEVSKMFLQNVQVFSKVSISTQNLLVYWNFDNSNANPAFGNPTYILNNPGSITYSAGKLGTGINLPINSRIRITQNLWNMVTAPTSFSVALWVKKNSASTTPQQAVIAGSIFGPMAFHFAFSDQNGVNLDQSLSYAQTTGASQYRYISITRSVVLEEWVHIVGTYNLSNTTMKFYVNGNLVGTQINVTPPTTVPHSTWTGFAINGSTIDTTNSEYGDDQSFDMVSLWNRTLTDIEAQELYNNFAGFNSLI